MDRYNLDMELPFHPKSPDDPDVIVFQEIFSRFARLFYLGVAIFWLFPLLVWEQIPSSVHWMIIALSLFAEPFFLWFIIGRRIVTIDFSRRLVSVDYGIFLPLVRRRFDLDNFKKVSVVESITGNNGSAVDVDGFYYSENHHKLTATFYLAGEQDLLLYELGFSCTDDESKEKYQQLKVAIPEYIETLLKCDQRLSGLKK